MSERKQFKFEVKSIDEEKGTFEGYASVFRQSQDKVGDIVMPGAFKKTINDHNGEIPLFWMHDIMSPVGLAKVEEDSHGLKVHGAFTRGVQKAEESYLFMKQGVIKSMSIGYDVVKKEIKNGVRYLQELKVPDISLVVGSFAADDQALVTAVKATEKDVAADYPWEECISDMMEEYGDEDTANRVCGAIRAKKLEKIEGVDLVELLGGINKELDIKPKAKEKALQVTEAVKDTSADKEAAEILNALKAVSIGFDPQKATDRVEELLRKLN
jgi:HK97 family phage prohead protease